MVSGTIWLKDIKEQHLIQKDEKITWMTHSLTFCKYIPTGRKENKHYEYMYIGDVYQ